MPAEMLWDAHCHLEAVPPEERDPAGVGGWLCAGYSPPRWALQAKLEKVWHAFGLHPWAVADHPDYLDELSTRLHSAVAVGEIGLDRSRLHQATFALQEDALRAQLALARERDLPVILHVVGAPGRMLEILRSDGVPGGMVHGFRGPRELIEPWLKLGLYLSLGASSPAFPEIPEDRLLLETDAPGGAPLASLVTTLERVARERGVSPAHLERATEANLHRAFPRGRRKG